MDSHHTNKTLSHIRLNGQSETGNITSGVAGHDSTKAPTTGGEDATTQESKEKQTEKPSHA